jgi:signal transduction protein with GAF and PtsI domain
MLVKPGIGPGGLSLRTGKPTLWTKLHSSQPILQMECPLIDSERLHAAAAVPIIKGELICGVLLIARQSPAAYDDGELAALHQHAQILKTLIEPAG